MDVGTRNKNLREESGLTQLAFAKVLNINNSTLCQYESGDRIPSDDIKGRIADYFCVSMDYLMGRTSIREKPLAESKELSSAEVELVNAYRDAPANVQAAIRTLLERK